MCVCVCVYERERKRGRTYTFRSKEISTQFNSSPATLAVHCSNGVKLTELTSHISEYRSEFYMYTPKWLHIGQLITLCFIQTAIYVEKNVRGLAISSPKNTAMSYMVVRKRVEREWKERQT